MRPLRHEILYFPSSKPNWNILWTFHLSTGRVKFPMDIRVSNGSIGLNQHIPMASILASECPSILRGRRGQYVIRFYLSSHANKIEMSIGHSIRPLDPMNESNVQCAFECLMDPLDPNLMTQKMFKNYTCMHIFANHWFPKSRGTKINLTTIIHHRFVSCVRVPCRARRYKLTVLEKVFTLQLMSIFKIDGWMWPTSSFSKVSVFKCPHL